MRIPRFEEAVIAPEKITEYLLNDDHPEGKSKARFLALAGFERTEPQALDAALRAQHLPSEARFGKPSPFGIKYEVTGPLTGPAGAVIITSIWIVRHGEPFPRLITIVPETRR